MYGDAADDVGTVLKGRRQLWRQARSEGLRPRTREVRSLALDADLGEEIEDHLSRLVLAAQTGSAAARNDIYHLLQVKISRWVDREWLAIRDRSLVVEPGDVHGEAFLVLADLIEQWPGDGGFGAYVMRVFPWRLRAAVREQAGLPVRLRQAIGYGGWSGSVALTELAGETPTAGLAAEQSWLADQAISLLEAIAEPLAEHDRLLLIWRVRDGETMTAIARRLGVNRRTLHRRWDRITEWIRDEWLS